MKRQGVQSFLGKSEHLFAPLLTIFPIFSCETLGCSCELAMKRQGDSIERIVIFPKDVSNNTLVEIILGCCRFFFACFLTTSYIFCRNQEMVAVFTSPEDSNFRK